MDWYNTTSMQKKKSKAQTERGMVSFTVTLIMMMVITLIVLGFSQVTRRNERETLDRQLSSQAFYAAESGINVTVSAIKRYITTGGSAASLATKSDCTNASGSTDYAPGTSGGQGSVISAMTTGVQYSCVLVDPHPKDLTYPVTTDSSTVAHIQSTTGKLATLNIAWYKQADRAAETGCGALGAGKYPAATDWNCGYGLIRVDLSEAISGSSLDADDVASKTVTLYLSPDIYVSGKVTVNYTTKAYTVSANCTNTNCQATITLPTSNGGNYYARLISMYRDANDPNTPGVDISGTVSGGADATFTNGQAVVDVTGRAQDELRRVQARLDLSQTADAADIPPYAISSSSSICKHFSLTKTDDVPSDVCQ